MPRRFGRALVATLVGLTFAVTHQVHARSQAEVDDSSRTVWSGVYTDRQAERGSIVYFRTCSRCHGSDLEGNAVEEYPALSGDDFLDQWENETLARLTERIRTGMPFDRPGSLTAAEAADLTAYLLRSSGMPAGAAELPSNVDVLRRVVLTRLPENE
jgi:cytochrome c